MILDQGIVNAFDEDGGETDNIELCNMKQRNDVKVMENICQCFISLSFNSFPNILKISVNLTIKTGISSIYFP